MSKIAKQVAAGVFLTILKATGYSVKKIARFSAQERLNTIAVFSTTALGDFLLNTPAIGAIKARWPDAKLLLVINQRNKDLATGSPLFDEILYWNGKVNGMLPLAKTLRRYGVDATFILHSHTPYDIIAASLARSRYILKDVYYNDYQGRADFLLAPYLSAFYDNRQNGNIHLIHQKTQLLNAVGIDTPSEEMFIPAPFTPEHHDIPVIGIHAGASTPERCWPEENFSRLIEQLISNHDTIQIELIGAAGEKALNQRIIEGMSVASDRVKNVAGTTNLIQLAAKVAGFKALVVGDTGPLHIAIAVKTPSVGLYGSQSAIDGAAPIQDQAIHQFIRSPEDQSGIKGVSIAEVYAATVGALRSTSALKRLKR